MKWVIKGVLSYQPDFHGHESANKCTLFMNGYSAAERHRRQSGLTDDRIGGQKSEVGGIQR